MNEPSTIGNGSAPAAATIGPGSVPRPAEALELIGEYKDSGLREPPYLVRRGDGQVVQLSRLLYIVASHVDGRSDIERIARAVSERFGRTVSPQDVAFLVEQKLRPAGVVVGADGGKPKARRSDPLLALRHRAALVPASVVRATSRIFAPLFNPAIVGATLAWMLTLDVWLFLHHGVAQGTLEIVRDPLLVFGVLGLMVAATLWHEIGHASACRYGGATPGGMGAGLYLIWPAFYTDVTDAYRLDRAGRLRTDLGGIYFNGLFILALAIAYLATDFEPLLVVIVLQHVQMLQQLFPFVRLDGYYVLTDLAGVPDLLSRVKPVLGSLFRRRSADARVTELKPWVRVVASIYVVALAGVFGAIAVLFALHAPRFAATAHNQFLKRRDLAEAAISSEDWTTAAIAGIELAALLLPVIGLGLIVLRVLRMLLGRLARRFAPRAPALRIGFAFVLGIAAASAVFAWGPAGDLLSRQSHPPRKLKASVSRAAESAAKRAARAEGRKQRQLIKARYEELGVTPDGAVAPASTGEAIPPAAPAAPAPTTEPTITETP